MSINTALVDVYISKGDLKFQRRSFSRATFYYESAFDICFELHQNQGLNGRHQFKNVTISSSLIALIAELNLKIGLSYLHLSSEKNSLQVFEIAIQAFNDSFDWGSYDPQYFFGNLEVSC